MIGEYIFGNAFSASIQQGHANHFEKGRFRMACDQDLYQEGHLTVLLKGNITKTFDGGDLNREAPESSICDYYKKYGTDFAKHLDGVFFIVLYDSEKDQLSLHNNRYTCHSAYYHQDESRFVFSNKLTKIIHGYIDQPKPHMGAVRSFLSNGFTSTDQTQVDGIKKMLPAYHCVVTKDGSEFIHHWDEEIQFKRKADKNLERSIDRYIDLYREGLSNYLAATKPKKLATLLSGGNDTSFVLANLKEVSDLETHAYTATFPGWAWNEESFAKNISEKFGANFHPVPFRPEDVDLVGELIAANEEPVVGSSLPLHMIGKKAKEDGMEVMFGGDGGDTLWGEYYPVAEYHRYVKSMPKPMRKLAHKVAKGLVKLTDWERFWELAHVSELFVEDNYYEDFMRKLCTYRHFSDAYQQELLTPQAFEHEPPKSSHEIKFTKENFRDALIEGKLYNAFYTYQSFHTYNCMEYSGLDLYFPTIQKEVIQFITDLPYSWVNGGTTFHRLMNHKSINRRLHKKALARFLRQDEIYNRSFDIPWYNILKPREDVLELLREKLKKRGWYNETAIDELFESFKNQKAKDYELLELKHHGYRIFTLLSLEIWCIYTFEKGYLDKDFHKKTLEELLRQQK